MRLFALGLATAAALVLGAAIAGAAPLNFQGTLTIQIGNLPAMVTTGGGVATLNGANGIPSHLVSLAIAASRGNVGGTATVLVTDPGALAGVKAIVGQFQLGTGTLAPIPGAPPPLLTKSVLPVGGVLKFCQLSAACTSFIPLVLTQPTGTGGIKGLGVGGTVTASNGMTQVSLFGRPWAVKATPSTFPVNFFVHGPASGTTSTAQPGGEVVLVTPAKIHSNLSQDNVGVLTQLTVRFIPEPGTLLLLGSGVAGVLLLGRNRIRNHDQIAAGGLRPRPASRRS